MQQFIERNTVSYSYSLHHCAHTRRHIFERGNKLANDFWLVPKPDEDGFGGLFSGAESLDVLRAFKAKAFPRWFQYSEGQDESGYFWIRVRPRIY